MNGFNSFFKYLGIAALSIVLGTCWGGLGLIGFAFIFGTPSIIICSGILTYLDHKRHDKILDLLKGK